MTSQIFYSYTVAAFVVLASILMLRRRQAANGQQPATKPRLLANVPPEQLPKYIQSLLAELPSCVILQADVAAFQQAIDYSWAQQNREIIPACIVRPRDAQQLGKAVVILKREHDSRSQAGAPIAGFFAVRSGGANPGLGAATVQDKALDEKGLIVMGGRNSPVGVGGLTLQGKIVIDLRLSAGEF
jgi:hypothetical protein